MRRQRHGVWITELESSDGATATVADHGAHVLSWTPAGGGPALYLSACSQYGGEQAIRGGVPVIFPQFAERGPGRHHGFARRVNWRQEFAGIEQGSAVARYRLSGEDGANADWPHPFELEYQIGFSGQDFHMSMTVRNCAVYAWEFGAALHTYFLIDDIDRVAISGLNGNAYIDKTRAGAILRQESEALRIEGEVDRIYTAVEKPLVLSDGARVVTVDKHGFEDVVIWNPGPAAQPADMAPGDFRSFVCVEAGAVARPVTLRAGEQWRGSQSIRVGK